MGPCRSCQCRSGEIRCAEMQCPKKRCRPNEILVTPPDQCCSRCIETPGVCTVFGDPHYKTFDGKFFSFQGSCKYQLTADCVDHTFSIRVTNDARTTKYSSWTKTVTLKMGDYKVNLGQKMRVKINGQRIETPFRSERVFIERLDDMIVVETDLNIKMTWDGSNYLQVQVPVSYKNKLCGLCGNYNNVFRDDLTSRRGVNMTENEVVKFANSWRVGGTKACARQKENLSKPPTCRLKKPSTICKPLQRTDFFGNCNSRLNPDNYFEACKLDMCECPTGMCYCESFAAYARECQRLGVQLSNWRLETNCEQNSVQHKQNLIQKLEEIRRHRRKGRNRKQDNIFKHIPKPILIQYTTLEGRTPPPLY
jgi:BMP-binding endothelial regulator protein